MKTVVIGGAYSVDKYARIYSIAPWFELEQPSEEIKAYVEAAVGTGGLAGELHTHPCRTETVRTDLGVYSGAQPGGSGQHHRGMAGQHRVAVELQLLVLRLLPSGQSRFVQKKPKTWCLPLISVRTTTLVWQRGNTILICCAKYRICWQRCQGRNGIARPAVKGSKFSKKNFQEQRSKL